MIKVGDRVAIRGDLRRTYYGFCVYTPEQLAGGKYILNSVTGEVWIGKVEKIQDDMAFVGGGWRGVDRLVPEGDIDVYP